ncbi:hypothetical protein GGTG_07946 [Gaeumannomyces tritici R3-111a-1]|uniref:Uncharacterized protein n=1 Tax=Gaeumannomyces tritici (strain R3-111a-1) TaxID=644352 RepID=J3P356_GAET3|nr:hypothetical protein GGTG_07946 [Gaeumannomyces tritici R3-111a-1]EJT74098.1 hypothetical protein GGTG_07946 [Gaeumannomyces tritici R3-111a-1]
MMRLPRDGAADAQDLLDDGLEVWQRRRRVGRCDLLDRRQAPLGGGGRVRGAEGVAQLGLDGRVVGQQLQTPEEGGAGGVVAGDDEADRLLFTRG